ncbi:mucin-2 [Drosophila rhopaloa]|uniref:Mucin-2 n=1 Tax=Drosophila rhopaloa TaxID=1041015 RepID=A0ABM5HNY3_DRORH|nr:mucin-2 [Drosophila rhopaloa]
MHPIQNHPHPSELTAGSSLRLVSLKVRTAAHRESLSQIPEISIRNSDIMLSKSMSSALIGCLIINAICVNAQTNIVQPSCPTGYQYVDGKCLSSASCPEGYYLHIDGKCYLQTNFLCKPGYFLNTDGKCYRTNPEPCPFETTTTTTTEPTTTTTTTTELTTTTTTTTTEPTTTTTTTTEPTTTTTTTEPTTTTTTTEPTTTTTTTTEPTTTTTTEPPQDDLPIPDELTRCPPGSVFIASQCRKIVCSEGEFHAGRCISPACPQGTVWYGKSCQEPGYITTILEISNLIHNEHKYTVTSENINRVEYITAAPYDPDKDKSYDPSTPENVPDNIVEITTTTTRRPWIYTRPTTKQPVVDELFPGRDPKPGCCFVKSARICINYAPNWVCSSKEKKFCDPRVCTAPVVYLKPPQIVHGENPKRVVMPPNPPLLACSTPECKESEVLDCSGCKDNQREKCSPGCYSYYCPNGSCAFMNTEDFCGIYPGEFGCNAKDGCIWDWCSKKCY